MASFSEAPAGDVARGAKIFKTKCVPTNRHVPLRAASIASRFLSCLPAR